MALFRRKKVDPSVLPEVDQYYTAQRRDSTGLAWLLALVSIVLVAGVIVALFLGGRFIYNKVVEKPETSETADVSDAPSFDGTPNPSNPTDQPAETPSDQEQDQDDESNDDEETAVTPAPQTTTVTPSRDLPNTGPADTVAIFIAITVIAALSHSVVSRRS